MDSLAALAVIVIDIILIYFSARGAGRKGYSVTLFVVLGLIFTPIIIGIIALCLPYKKESD